MEEKEAQHTALEVALKEYGYDVTVLPMTVGASAVFFSKLRPCLTFLVGVNQMHVVVSLGADFTIGVVF